MPDTHEIESTIVPNNNRKSDLWKHFNKCEQETGGRIEAGVVGKQCNCIIKLAGETLTCHRT